MNDSYDLNRFVQAQKSSYAQALAEVKNGRKVSHWMWYIFPQLKGLGYSETAKFYAIGSSDEAAQYLRHPTLGARLVEISTVLLSIQGKSANQIFGSPDDMKLQSSMTLFSLVGGADPVFGQVLDTFFSGKKDPKTIELLNG